LNSWVTALSLLSLWASLTALAARSNGTQRAVTPVLQLSQSRIDLLGQCSVLSLKPGDDRARLGLHQLTVALPVRILAIEYLSEG
jgi:hypothetical protein